MYTPTFAKKLARWAEEDAKRDERKAERQRKRLEAKALKLLQGQKERHKRYQKAYLKRKAQNDVFWVLATKQASNLKHRAKQLGIPYQITVAQLREFLTRRYPFVCEYCQLPVPNDKISLDHKTPLSRGGYNLLSNLAVTCYGCNRIKYTLTEEEFRQLTSTARLQEVYAKGVKRHRS